MGLRLRPAHPPSFFIHFSPIPATLAGHVLQTVIPRDRDDSMGYHHPGRRMAVLARPACAHTFDGDDIPYGARNRRGVLLDCFDAYKEWSE